MSMMVTRIWPAAKPRTRRRPEEATSSLPSSLVVELVPFRAHERERLLLPQGVFLGERDGMLCADAVKKFGQVALFDGGTFLVRCFFGEFAQRARNGRAVAECWAAQRLFAGRVGAFLGVKFEGSAFLDSCEVGLHVSDPGVFVFRRIF
jgi:hypothetical protein